MSDFQEVTYENPVEGQIRVPETFQPQENEDELSTLDEPIRLTFLRDVRAIGQKFLHIVYPKKDSSLLKDWDLWGPLVLCVLMALFLQGARDEATGSGGPQFAEVFVVVWLGAAVVTLNSQLLGGEISFFQSVCVLGYCMFPLVTSLLFCWLIIKLAPENLGFFIVRFVIVALGYGWSIFASIAFLGDSQPPKRKALAVYPICLFYMALAWMIITLT